MRNRKITVRDVEIYRELVNQVKSFRNLLKKRHKRAEQKVGAGRLPALILPEAPKSVSRINWRKLRYQQYLEKIRAMRQIIAGGIKGWYKRTYKDKILELWRDELIGESPEGGVNGRIKKGWYYSEDQIALADDKSARFMLLYNRLARMNISQFMVMYDSGLLPAFRLLYDAEKGGFHNYYLEELEDTFRNTSLRKLAKLHGGLTQAENEYLNDLEGSVKLREKNIYAREGTELGARKSSKAEKARQKALENRR